MAFVLSPNMNLPIPGVGTEAGPTWAIELNNALTLVDTHDHTPGKGVLITPAAININANLSLNGNMLTSTGGITLAAQGSTPAINTLYESGVDLYFVDGLGNNIPITANGSISGSPGSISGLTSPASATYVSGSKTFVWQSGASIAANLDAASILMRNITPNSTYALTLQPPAALSSNYSLTLPTLPASQQFLSLDASGNIAGYVNIAAGLTASNLSASANIAGTQLLPGSLQTANYAAGSVTTAKLASPTVISSASQSNVITSVGTPVNVGTLQVSPTTVYGAKIYLQPHINGTSPGFIQILGDGTISFVSATIILLKNGAPIASWSLGAESQGSSPLQINFPISTVYYEDYDAPGVNTYRIQAQCDFSNCVHVNFTNCRLVGQEAT